MISYRVIARMDIKGPNLIKGISFEGLRVLGKPADFAARYANAGADELLYIDTVASLYGRNQLEALLEETTENVFIPITVGGGISSVADVRRLLNAGADKVAINTAALKRPQLISEIADHFGSQALTVSIEAKRTMVGWEAYTDCGRERTHMDAILWAEKAAELGAGEILITSIDRDGTRKGFDADLLRNINVGIPVVAAGGFGCVEHLSDALSCDAVAIGSALHYGDVTIGEVKGRLAKSREVRI